jgi:hypothetical protein
MAGKRAIACVWKWNATPTNADCCRFTRVTLIEAVWRAPRYLE